MPELYNKVFDTVRSHGHRNKCVVIAMSILFDLDYQSALQTMNSACNRTVSRNGGYFQKEWLPLYDALARSKGARLVRMEACDIRPFAKTTKSFTPAVARRLGIVDGLICTRGHVSAIKDGRIEDWADDRQKKILCIYRLAYLDQPIPQPIPQPKPRKNAQVVVLAMLQANPGGYTIPALARHIGVEESTIRIKLSRLRKAGYQIERTKDVYILLRSKYYEREIS